MQKDKTFGVSVSLTNKAISTVSGYQNRTKRNFSQTLNIIIDEWDTFSIELMKFKARKEANDKANDLKNAVVEK